MSYCFLQLCNVLLSPTGMYHVILSDYRYVPCHTVTYRYVPCHTVTYRYVPCHTVIYRHVPCHTVIYRYIRRKIQVFELQISFENWECTKISLRQKVSSPESPKICLHQNFAFYSIHFIKSVIYTHTKGNDRVKSKKLCTQVSSVSLIMF